MVIQQLNHKMKRTALFVIVISWVVGGCNAVKHSYRSGDFDKAVEQAVKKLRSNPDHEETISYLEASYAKLYRQRLERITFLKKEGRPENVLPVYDEFSSLVLYGNMIKPLLPLHMASKQRDATFTFVHDEELIEAKKNAAEYLYVFAGQKLNSNNRLQARAAYDLYEQLMCIYPDYKDVAEMYRLAQVQGTNQVFVKLENNSNAMLYAALEQQVTAMPLNDLNEKWVNFYGPPASTRTTDYNIIINIRQIIVSPDLQTTVATRTETKNVADGWTYALDANGNVKKDSLGNDIKTPKTKTIRCGVTEYLQQKTAAINGSIDFYDARRQSLLYSEPFSSNKIFQHSWAIANGDLEALTRESAAMIRVGPAPYPSETDMLLQGEEDLKRQMKQVISNHMDLVRN